MFSNLDWVIVSIYIAGIVAIGLFYSRKKESSDEYFLASRNTGWFVIGAALFASNIGSEHLVGLAGTGANSGLPTVQFEILASLILLILGWFFVPYYLASKISTTPEFLEKRFSPFARYYLSIISIFAYVITKIAVTVMAGGIVFETLMGIDFWVGALIIILLTGIYTILGGLKAVVYTETIQTFVLIFGSIVVLIFGLNELGGWNNMVEIAPVDFMSVWRPSDHPEFPWTGIIFGAPILGIWYWCTDQNIVQRVLSAKNIHEARRGTIFAGFLKITPLFLFVMPGIIAYCLNQEGVLQLENSDQALPVLVQTLLPSGLRGLVAAGLLAALMSSLASVFNSSSTLVTLDIYKKFKPNSSEKELVFVGQVSTAILVVLGLLSIQLIEGGFFGGTLFVKIQAIQGLISPPIAAVFLLGIFNKRVNNQGALASLGVGFVLGMMRFFLLIFEPQEGTILHLLVSINFLHYAAYLFLVCTVVLIGVSYLTPPPDESQTKGLTYDPSKDNTKKSFEEETQDKTDKILSGLVVLAVVAVWVIFR